MFKKWKNTKARAMSPHKKGPTQGPMLKHISKEKGLKKIKENMKGGN